MKGKDKLPEPDSMPTIWLVPDAAWKRIEPVIQEYTPWGTRGPKPRTDFRKVLNAVIYRMRTHCQWSKVPRIFGDDSRIYYWFQVWRKNGVFERIWRELLEECPELGSVKWKWKIGAKDVNRALFKRKKPLVTQPIEKKPE
ncbi:MAG: transposase [Planctomycetota bacterium]|jgi:transposase|nr:transposase [Planctomycetota bacterium]